jgi:hypothetical protein
MTFKLKEHLGVVLEPSPSGFDSFSSAWGSILNDPIHNCYYYYYSGAVDKDWSKASIGIAKSTDGIRFVRNRANPVISLGGQSWTPAVFSEFGRYWMVFAVGSKQGRKLALAVADTPDGPWTSLKELIAPSDPWEVPSVDLGPSVVKSNGEHLVFYSNVPRTLGRLSTDPRSILFGPRRIRRRIGILKLHISDSEVTFERWAGNPLAHMNGKQGSWNESLFCPGYVERHGKHYLFPATSTYSVGAPFKQYVGLIEDTSPFFQHPTSIQILINGPEEKNDILPSAKTEIALDTPSPLIRENELWLYYAVMDRADRIWKTALSIFSL